MLKGDVHIVTGMDAIVNPDNIKPGIDLKELERQMISGGLITQKIEDPKDRFIDELQEMAEKLGVSFGPEKKSSTIKTPISDSSEEDDYDNDRYASQSTPGTKQQVETKHISESAQERSYTDEPESKSRDFTPANRFAKSAAAAYDSKYDSKSYSSTTYEPKYGNDDLHSRTLEQERRSHIDSIVGTSDNNFSFEKEKREDLKCAMLAEIDQLLSSLADEDIDLTRIPRVGRETNYDEVESILKMLRHKNDHTRYCSFAEEFLLFGAYALEELFDGKRNWFGRYQPDLTGWHNHVNVKLKRMRHDTGQIVSGVMQDYNIGPGARMLLELVPNMVLHSKMRKQQHGQSGLFNDDEMQNAMQNIRNRG